MTTVSQINPASVPQASVTLRPNHDSKVTAKGAAAIEKHHTVGQSVLRFLGTSEGLYRAGQLMERAPKWTNAMRQQFGLAKLPALDNLSAKGLTAWTWGTTYARIPVVTADAIESVQEVMEMDGKAGTKDQVSQEQAGHKVKKAFSDVTDAISMWCHGTSMTASLYPNTSKFCGIVTNLAEIVTLGHDLVSLDMNAQNLGHANRALTIAVTDGAVTPEVKKTIEETKKYTMIALAKDVMSVVSGILGLVFLATGTAVLPGIAMLTMSLATTVFAVTRKLYEETMHNKPICFADGRQVNLHILKSA